MKKISIIVPIYNVEKYIERCILSVIAQTYRPIECILVNDCTPDNSMDVVERILSDYHGDISFVVLNHQKNQGLSCARNTGIEHSTGEYIYFLDSDDELPNNSIQDLVNCAEANNCPEVVFGRTQGVRPDRRFDIYSKKNRSFYTNKDIFIGYLNDEWLTIACNKLLRRDLFDVHKLFFSPGICHEDILWSFEASTVINSLIFCDSTTYYYHLADDNSISRGRLTEKRVTDFLFIYKRELEYIDKIEYKTLLCQFIETEMINMYYVLFRTKFNLSYIAKCKKEMDTIISDIKRKTGYGYFTLCKSPIYKKILFKLPIFK